MSEKGKRTILRDFGTYALLVMLSYSFAWMASRIFLYTISADQTGHLAAPSRHQFHLQKRCSSSLSSESTCVAIFNLWPCILLGHANACEGAAAGYHQAGHHIQQPGQLLHFDFKQDVATFCIPPQSLMCAGNMLSRMLQRTASSAASTIACAGVMHYHMHREAHYRMYGEERRQYYSRYLWFGFGTQLMTAQC